MTDGTVANSEDAATDVVDSDYLTCIGDTLNEEVVAICGTIICSGEDEWS